MEPKHYPTSPIGDKLQIRGELRKNNTQSRAKHEKYAKDHLEAFGKAGEPPRSDLIPRPGHDANISTTAAILAAAPSGRIISAVPGTYATRLPAERSQGAPDRRRRE